MLGEGFEKALDIAAGGNAGRPPKARGSRTHARVLVERFETQAKLIVLPHFDDVERRPVENDIGAFARWIDLDAKAVEVDRVGTSTTRRPRGARRVVLAGDELAAQQFGDGDFGIGDKDIAPLALNGEAGIGGHNVSLSGPTAR